MGIKIGDKIRFLNSVGGGIVTKYKGKDSVWVEDQDGFEVPIFIHECVVVGEQDTFMPKNPYAKQKAEEKANDPIIQPRQTVQVASTYKPEETKEGDRMNVWLAYLPTDPKALSQSKYEAYFINESNYYLYFNYMTRANNSYTLRCSGTVEPNTKIFLEEFGKESLNDLEQVCVQLIAFKKDKPFALKNPASIEIRLDTVKFYKVHSFRENDFFEEDALIYPLIRQDVPEKQTLVSVEKLKEAMFEKVALDRQPAHALKKKSSAPSVIEIDLHIEQLLDTTAGMSNTEIITYQLDVFHKKMKEQESQRGQKIVFIHGKGDGVLRKAIEKELRGRYKQHYFQDASFREYGFGATMVTIK